MVNRWGNSGNSVRLFFFLSFLNLILFFNFIVLVLPYINMNPPQVYTCSPSWTLLPPPSPYHPSGSSQCTSPKHPVSCIKPGLATCFIYNIIHFYFNPIHQCLGSFGNDVTQMPWTLRPPLNKPVVFANFNAILEQNFILKESFQRSKWSLFNYNFETSWHLLSKNVYCTFQKINMDVIQNKVDGLC